MEGIGDSEVVQESSTRSIACPHRSKKVRAGSVNHLLGIEYEKYLVAALKRLETNGLLYYKLVRRMAYIYAEKLNIHFKLNFENGMASRVWLRYFRERNPTLKIRIGNLVNIKDETIDKMLEDCLKDKYFDELLIKKKENEEYECKTSTAPSLPNVGGTIIKLEQEEVQIHPACEEEITIEENKIEIKVYSEQTDVASNDNTGKKITEDDTEAYIHSVIDTNLIRITGGVRDWESNSHPNRIRIARNINLDNYDMFAQYLAPKLRHMKTAEDQLKMIKRIMLFFARDRKKPSERLSMYFK